MICDYGCGQEATYQFKNGKWCCSKHWSSCPESKEYLRKRMIGDLNPLKNPLHKLKHKKSCSSENFKEKQRINILNNNPMNNPETKIKHKIIMEKMSGKNNPLYTCDGALNRHKKAQQSKATRKRKSISTLKAVKKGIHPMQNKSIIKEISKKNKITFNTTEMLEKFRKMNSFDLNDFKQKHPLLFKIEDIKSNKEYEFLGHCKNHKCPNSKEHGGWFILSKTQLFERIRNIESGYDGSYFYCSEKCKKECPLFGKRVSQLIKEDQIRAGYIEDPWYTSSEYYTWRDKVFELDKGLCVWCEKPATIAHHILPQKTHPNLSLDPENGLSSCKECHYKYGHIGECSTGSLSKLICERIIRIKEK